MTIKQYRNRFIEQLAPLVDGMEAENIFHLSLEHYLNLKRIDVALHPERQLTVTELELFDSVLAKLITEIPIQYILGSTNFCGLDFDVNPSVLIPRPETEELVEWIIKDNEFSAKKCILDIGTGSGCIAIVLAKQLLHFEVSAIDISAEALKLAYRNAEKNSVTVNFIETNILESQIFDRAYDIIVSNPPYVRNLEKGEIKRNVVDHEPHLALFVDDDDPLLFYRKIAELAFENLSAQGTLYFEINQYLGAETAEMLRTKGFSNVELRKDIYGNDRMIRASR